MHAVGARDGTLASDAIVRLFCSKSGQNAKCEGGSPSVPTTSLSAHTRTFFGLNSLSLSGHKWQQQEHQQQLLFFLRISNSRHDLDDPSHAEDCAKAL